MDLSVLMRDRKSVRAFAGEPVPRDVLERILEDACRAPSAINMQPWDVHMVLGSEVKRLSKRLLRSYRERQLTCGPGSSKPLAEKFMERARESAQGLTELVAQDGRDFRSWVNEGSLSFYGAPAVVLLFLDSAFPPERMADIGIFAGYLLLSAAAEGVGTCPIGLVKAYKDDIKDQLNIPEDKILVLSVAMGRPAPDAAVNGFRSSRVGPAHCVRWVD